MAVDEACAPADWPPGLGILVMDKPQAITSRRVVDQVARLVPGVKVGHAGTLDPLASGVLVLCLEKATRLVERIQGLPKSYSAVVRLGARSDTFDSDGRIELEQDPRVPDEAEIEGTLAQMVGEVAQRPPAYSAKKIKGRRAYDLARAGQKVELAPRNVRIDRIALLAYTWPRLSLEIDCGGGTYIRSIARDLGESLGCGGLLEVLTRTRIGPFTIEHAVSPSVLAAEGIKPYLRPALDAIPDVPRLVLDAGQIGAVRQGRRLGLQEFASVAPVAGEVALVDVEGRLIALGEIGPEGGWVQPRKVFV
jgi:tRNA pseudouridine55 synthase